MSRFERIRELDAALGDPFDEGSPLNHRTSARWDEEEHYPREALDLLHGLEVARDFVPTALGGRLGGYDELLYVARAIAQRDLSVAVTSSAMVWSTLPFIAGDERLKREHAASLIAGNTPCLAYSEEAHGADLLANETIARPVPGGYIVHGRKWPINRATTGQSVVLLARTGEVNHPRGLSLFWFEKSSLDPKTFHGLPRAPTLGVRGCDISGIAFDGACVPDASRIGREGLGLEIALKGFHVTRTLCAGLSLGAVDAALRTTVRLARTRRLYGSAMIALPHVRQTLAEAYALLRALDAASLSAARALHVSPGQSPTISAIAKYAIPHLSEAIVGRLATIHGARFYLREHHDWGLMQRVFRDNLLIGIFDGSSPVNLHALSTQLPALARTAPLALGGRSTDASRAQAARERAAISCNLHVSPPPFDGARLELASRGADDVLNACGLVRDEIERALAGGTARDALSAQLRIIERSLAAVYADVAALEKRDRGATRGSASAPALSRAAERYAILHVAAAAVHAWWRSQGASSRRVEPWVLLALSQLLPSETSAIADGALLASLHAEVLDDLLGRSDRPSGYHFM